MSALKILVITAFLFAASVSRAQTNPVLHATFPYLGDQFDFTVILASPIDEPKFPDNPGKSRVYDVTMVERGSGGSVSAKERGIVADQSLGDGVDRVRFGGWTLIIALRTDSRSQVQASGLPVAVLSGFGLNQDPACLGASAIVTVRDEKYNSHFGCLICPEDGTVASFLPARSNMNEVFEDDAQAQKYKTVVQTDRIRYVSGMASVLAWSAFPFNRESMGPCPQSRLLDKLLSDFSVSQPGCYNPDILDSLRSGPSPSRKQRDQSRKQREWFSEREPAILRPLIAFFAQDSETIESLRLGTLEAFLANPGSGAMCEEVPAKLAALKQNLFEQREKDDGFVSRLEHAEVGILDVWDSSAKEPNDREELVKRWISSCSELNMVVDELRSYSSKLAAEESGTNQLALQARACMPEEASLPEEPTSHVFSRGGISCVPFDSSNATQVRSSITFGQIK